LWARRIKYLMDPAVRLVFRAAGMDKDEGRFDRAAFQRFMLSHEPTTGGTTCTASTTTRVLLCLWLVVVDWLV
jgi:hypothetical protein